MYVCLSALRYRSSCCDVCTTPRACYLVICISLLLYAMLCWSPRPVYLSSVSVPVVLALYSLVIGLLRCADVYLLACMLYCLALILFRFALLCTYLLLPSVVCVTVTLSLLRLCMLYYLLITYVCSCVCSTVLVTHVGMLSPTYPAPRICLCYLFWCQYPCVAVSVRYALTLYVLVA